MFYKYITIFNTDHDPDNKITQQPPRSFLSGKITVSDDQNVQDISNLKDQLDKITKAAIECNCEIIGYAFSEVITHADVYDVINFGILRSAGFITEQYNNHRTEYTAFGESISLREKSNKDDSALFNGYYFNLSDSRNLNH